MRNPNGYGSIRKLSGNRRRPFQVLVTTGWQIVDGKAKQVQKSIGYFEDRPAAMIALAEYNKSPYDIDSKTTTFKDVYEKAILPQINEMKPNSAKSWKSAYTHTTPIHNIRMVDIRKAHMQDIINSLSGKSQSVQNNVKKLCRAVFKWSMENDVTTKDYSQFIEITAAKSESKKKPFTKKEIDLLWENIDYTDNKKYTKVQTIDSMIILVYTGLRINELLELKVEDIHLEERYINVNGTKTDAAKRIMPIHKNIIPLIERRMNLGSEYLIPAPDGGHMTDQGYREFIFSPICEMLGMKHNPHECRHTFVTFAKRCKLDALLLKKMIGHASQDITEDVYTHVFHEDLIKEIDKLEF